MSSSTLGLDVVAFEQPCQACAGQVWWIIGLIPVYRPGPEEFVTTDFAAAVEVARRILQASDDCDDLAEQLGDRPGWQRGASHNPNICLNCGYQAEWHTLEGIITAALHGDEIRVAYGRIPVQEWRALKSARHSVWVH